MASEKLTSILNSIAPKKRFYKDTEAALKGIFENHSCVFGLPTDDRFQTITEIPKNTKALYFYFGNRINDLLDAVLETGVSENLEHLSIGYTRLNSIDRNNYDYSEVCEVLSAYQFPKLKKFEFGEDFLLANEESTYGMLGNITNVLENMPNLERLDLLGNFELTKTLDFKHLRNLEVLINYWPTNINGEISSSTLLNILSSKFDELKLMSLYLDFHDNNYEYSLPQSFLDGKNTPQLELLELYGKFVAGTVDTIERSKLRSQLLTCSIKGIKEPDM